MIPLNLVCGPKKNYLHILSTIFFLLIVDCGYGQNDSSVSDWSQWMGKDSKAIWNLDISKESLDPSDLIEKWRLEIGTGYSGPTISHGKVYVMDYMKNSERVLCVDLQTGSEIWTHTYETNYSVGYPTGPRASVLIEENRAYSFGSMGDLHCLDADSGKVLWYVDGDKEYNVNMPIWGLASSPIIENDLLIIQMGGTPNACLVAFDKYTGKEIWSALPDNASYSTPIIIDQAGKKVLVCWTGDNLVGMYPESGKLYWEIPYKRKKEVINISTPVYAPPYIFLSSFYDGSMLISIDQYSLSAELAWKRSGENERNTDALHCIISTPLIQDKYIYGVDSYGELRCLDLLTGDRIWTDSSLVPYGRWANAHFVKQGGNTWAFNELGELILSTLSPSGFNELGRVELIQPVRVSPNPRGGVNWAFPAFSERKIVARSDAFLVCYELLK